MRVALFVVTSAACGLAPTLGLLVAFRFAQGSAAAAMMPSSMALVRQAYPRPAPRAHAIAIWATGGALASTCGPVVGGALAQANWRWIFLLNVPVGLAVLALLTAVGRSSTHPVPFDWPGQVSGAVAMGAVTYAAITTGSLGLMSPRVLFLAFRDRYDVRHRPSKDRTSRRPSDAPPGPVSRTKSRHDVG